MELLGKGEKPTNPKDTIGSDKLPLNLWPASATAMGCLGLLEGALKYGRTNWRGIGVQSSIYVDACKRHLDAWYEGEECAPDSGVPHLANALACLAILIDAQAAGKLNDDRNYSGDGYRPLVEQLTPHVQRLKALFKHKDPKQYTIADNPPATVLRTREQLQCAASQQDSTKERYWDRQRYYVDSGKGTSGGSCSSIS